jgi:predicted GIY-YIG superfamily endonuclease
MIKEDGADRDSGVPVGTALLPRWRTRLGRECRVCGQDQLARMATNKSRPDGHDSICRLCKAAENRGGHTANREARLAKMRARHAANRETDSAAFRAWYAAHRARRVGVSVEELASMPESERRRRLEAKPTYVYRWHAYNIVRPDEGFDETLYIGISTDPDERYLQHLERYAFDDSAWPWWAERRSDELFPDRPSALAAEAEAIRTEHPRFNIAGSGYYVPVPRARRLRFFLRVNGGSERDHRPEESDS